MTTGPSPSKHHKKLRRSEYLELFNLVLLATHARFVNPLRPLAPLFDAQARREEAAVRRHDAVIGAKVDAVLARPPPDWTIAGATRRFCRVCVWG